MSTDFQNSFAARKKVNNAHIDSQRHCPISGAGNTEVHITIQPRPQRGGIHYTCGIAYSSLVYIKTCTGLHNIKAIVDKRHCIFIDKLISDVRYSNLLLVYGFNYLYSL